MAVDENDTTMRVRRHTEETFSATPGGEEVLASRPPGVLRNKEKGAPEPVPLEFVPYISRVLGEGAPRHLHLKPVTESEHQVVAGDVVRLQLHTGSGERPDLEFAGVDITVPHIGEPVIA